MEAKEIVSKLIKIHMDYIRTQTEFNIKPIPGLYIPKCVIFLYGKPEGHYDPNQLEFDFTFID